MFLKLNFLKFKKYKNIINIAYKYNTYLLFTFSMDAKSNIFIKKIKLIESLSIRENAEIFDLLLVPRRVIGNEMINKINKT